MISIGRFRYLTVAKLSQLVKRVNGERNFSDRESFALAALRGQVMFCNQFQLALEKAPRLAVVDDVMRMLWRAYGEGQLSEADAAALSEAAEARRLILKAPYVETSKKAISGLRRPSRSPDRQRSIERRRGLATSGAVPSRIAAHFTVAEIAVLTLIAREHQCRGQCDFPIDKIAALAGVSRSSVQNALRRARKLGLIEVRERRRRGQRSDTNIIRVLSLDWLSWLTRGRRVQKYKHHEDTSIILTLSSQDKRRVRDEKGVSTAYNGALARTVPYENCVSKAYKKRPNWEKAVDTKDMTEFALK